MSDVLKQHRAGIKFMQEQLQRTKDELAKVKGLARDWKLMAVPKYKELASELLEVLDKIYEKPGIGLEREVQELILRAEKILGEK